MEYDELGCDDVNRRDQGMTKLDDILIPGLPNEVAILCITRVSRSYHCSMKGVCRSWWNLLNGRNFSMVRWELPLAEEWLYLWTQTANEACEEVWYCFDPALKKWWKLPTMPHDGRVVGDSAFASVDGKLFVVGGSVLNFGNPDEFEDGSYFPSRTVTYFDARKNCWKKAADLNIARANCMVGVIENHMYVFGGYMDESEETTITGEVYDPITDTWKLISNMNSQVTIYDGVVMGGKCYMVSIGIEGEYKGNVYNPHADEWAEMAHGLNIGWGSKSTVLNGKLYTTGEEYVAGKNAHPGYESDPRTDQLIEFYSPNKDVWKTVEESWGDDNDLMIRMRAVELVSLGGKLCIVSLENLGETDASEICMVTFEVKESSENVTCSMVSIDEFDLDDKYDTRPAQQAIKRCQVVAL